MNRIKLINMKIDPEAIKLVSPQIIRQNHILPIARTRHSITLAMAPPIDHQVLDDVRMAAGLDVIPVWADETEIEMAISQFLSFRLDPNMEKLINELRHTSTNADTVDAGSFLPGTDEAPIIRLVNHLLLQAVRVHCSDIHIEPQENDVRVRFRVDGELYEAFTMPKMFLPAMVSRIKIMGGMDISEKRLPQDGRFRRTIENRDIDFRISTLPITNGEKVVIRVLDKSQALTEIKNLGLTDSNQGKLSTLTHRPHGMILVTGSTGSGKTTTLYAMLKNLDANSQNIITLEDPVEYSLAGINQVQVNSKAGMTFLNGLGSILRQDPDIIMVGEIRDHATAQLAVQAALTGHLVLSTLHTNNAAGTVARLAEMGIEAFLLAASLVGVVSQCLVRRLCPHCRRRYTLNQATAAAIGLLEEAGQEFYHPAGCNMCRQLGYHGRIALQEIMLVGPLVRSAINQGAKLDNIEMAAKAEGMTAIREDGLAKARHGLTSLEEVMRVIRLEE